MKLLPTRLAYLCPLLLAIGGCADGPRRVAVTGTVTHKGQPLKYGTIRFEPEDPQTGQSGGAIVRDGQFAIAQAVGLMPGKYKVAISAPDTRSSGRPSPEAAPTGGPDPPELLPPRYNTKSALTAEISPSQPNELTFTLD